MHFSAIPNYYINVEHSLNRIRFFCVIDIKYFRSLLEIHKLYHCKKKIIIFCRPIEQQSVYSVSPNHLILIVPEMSKDLRFLLVQRASSITRGISPIIIDRNVSSHIINNYGVCVFQVVRSHIIYYTIV